MLAPFFSLSYFVILFLYGLTSSAEVVKVIKEVVVEDCPPILKPKVIIFTFYEDETQSWIQGALEDSSSAIGNLYTHNFTIKGFHSAFPYLSCNNPNATICILTTGEAEINAATTISALTSSPLFDLSQTYFLTTGVAGVNPEEGTLGDVALARYAVQGCLQYEIDARELPANFTTGYFPLSLVGDSDPTSYPTELYGTEVYELNTALLDIAASIAKTATLNDSDTAVAYRGLYASGPYSTTATQTPGIRKCDALTCDTFYSGTLLDQSFANYTKLVTNGSATYCMSAQEDNAFLEVMLRAAMSHILDFSRIIVIRTGSDFQRPPEGQSDLQNLLYDDQGGYEIALANMYLAGSKIVDAIVGEWETGRAFGRGIKPTNYVGDILGRLGGVPDFGPGPVIGEEEIVARGSVGDEEGWRGEGVGGRSMRRRSRKHWR